MLTESLAAPVLKWVGGKGQLLGEIERYVPKDFTMYYEPFIGGGALLFYLRPAKAVISDINVELVNLYRVIRNAPGALIADLELHQNDEAYFYATRALDREPDRYGQLSSVQQASRLLFLNKTCYNGLYRVNGKGQMNTPFGHYENPNIVNRERILSVSRYLNESNVRVLCMDFEMAVMRAERGSFVYFDPPYVPVSSSANFTSYTGEGFTLGDQTRLKSLCDRLDEKGVKFLLSNSSTEFVQELYQDYSVSTVMASRAVNSKANGRGKVKEVLVCNYDLEEA